MFADQLGACPLDQLDGHLLVWPARARASRGNRVVLLASLLAVHSSSIEGTRSFAQRGSGAYRSLEQQACCSLDQCAYCSLVQLGSITCHPFV